MRKMSASADELNRTRSKPFVQSNHEGVLLDDLHRAKADGFDGVVFDPGGLTFCSHASCDALTAVELPTVQVHSPNLDEREAFRPTQCLPQRA